MMLTCDTGDKSNPQHAPSVDQDSLARETEQLARQWNNLVAVYAAVS